MFQKYSCQVLKPSNIYIPGVIVFSKTVMADRIRRVEKATRSTVRSDVEERVAEERLAWNDKNIPAWPKDIRVLRMLCPLKSAVYEIRM